MDQIRAQLLWGGGFLLVHTCCVLILRACQIDWLCFSVLGIRLRLIASVHLIARLAHLMPLIDLLARLPLLARVALMLPPLCKRNSSMAASDVVVPRLMSHPKSLP